MKQLDLTLLYLIRGDEVLLALKKRGFGEGRWNGVGGKLEPGESIEQALVRECQEEIGVTPTMFEKIGEMLYDEIHNDTRKLMNLHIYFATEWEGNEVESEEMRPQWFKKTEIPYKDMWPADQQWLSRALRGEKLKGKFVLDDSDQVVSQELHKVQSFGTAL